MPTQVRLPLVGAANSFRSAAVGAQTCINLYGEPVEDPQARQKGIGALYGTPGKHLFKQYSFHFGGGTFGLWSGGGRLFGINSTLGATTDLVEWDSSGTEVSRHAFAGPPTGTPGQIFSNGNQLLVVIGGYAYCDNGSGPVACTFDNLYATVNTSGTTITLVSITTAASVLSGFASFVGGETVKVNGVNYTVAASPAPTATTMDTTASLGTQTGVAFIYQGSPVTATTGAYLDEYFIVQRPRGGSPDLGRQMNFSSVLNGLKWSSLDFFSAESEPSYIRSIWADNEQLYAFKDASFQVFQTDSGGFSDLKGAMSKFGSGSAWGNVSLAGKVYMLGAPGGYGSSPAGWIQAFVLDGFTPRKISGYAQEEHWNAAGLGANALSYIYEEDGHSFWVINFGTETWAFDSTTGAWHQRAGWNGSVFGSYLTAYHAFVPEWGTSGYHITSGDTTGSLFISSVNFYDDNGSDIGWQRAIPYEYEGGNQIYYGRMYLEAETGTVPSGAAPTVTRDYSDDRGNTFSGSETASLGAHNDYSTRLIWPLAPSSNSMGRVFRFSGHGQYKVALIDLQADISYGTT